MLLLTWSRFYICYLAWIASFFMGMHKHCFKVAFSYYRRCCHSSCKTEERKKKLSHKLIYSHIVICINLSFWHYFVSNRNFYYSRAKLTTNSIAICFVHYSNDGSIFCILPSMLGCAHLSHSFYRSLFIWKQNKIYKYICHLIWSSIFSKFTRL